MPLTIGFCIASSRLITEISNKISDKRFQQSVFAIMSAIGVFGIVSTTILITTNENSHYFDAAAFVNKYLEMNKDNRGNATKTITVISAPFYIWLPMYKLHLDNYVEWFPPVIKTEKLLSIVDIEFRKALSLPFTLGEQYQKIVDSYATDTIAMFGNHHAILLLTDLGYNNPKSMVVNLIDQTHVWKPSKHTKMLQNNNSLNIMVKTIDRNKEFNHAVLETYIMLKKGPPLLRLEYASTSLAGNAIFSVQIKDNENDKMLWSRDLENSSGELVKELIFLPHDIVGKSLEVGLNTVTQGAGEHSLSVKKAIVS
jgi:hypothetical protein